MRRYGIMTAIGLVVLVNIVILAGVAWNRSGEPDALMTLSERELRLVGGGAENSGIALNLAWRHYSEGQLDWFDRTRLEAIGFDCSYPLDAKDADRVYRKALPRKAYLAVEFEGPAWLAWKKKQEEQLKAAESVTGGSEKMQKEREQKVKQIRARLDGASRLFAVDLDKNPAALRQRYPDRQRYLILPALVSININSKNEDCEKKTKPIRTLMGSIDKVLVSKIHLPRDLAAGLKSEVKKSGRSYDFMDDGYWSYASDGKGKAIRYQALVEVGKRYEPWIRSLQINTQPVTAAGQ